MTRARLATLLGVQIAEEPHFLHYQAYGNTVPPRRPHETHAPSDEEVSVLFQQPFLPGTPRTLDRLTPVAHSVHLALRKSLFPDWIQRGDHSSAAVATTVYLDRTRL